MTLNFGQSIMRAKENGKNSLIIQRQRNELMTNNYLGLSDSEVQERVSLGQVNEVDTNIFKSKKEIIKTHTLTYFNFLNLFLGILVIISGQFKNITFMGVIILNSVIGIVQELKVKKLIDKLSVITASKAAVVRNGVMLSLPINEVVLDDVLVVESGDQVCSDCIVLESDGMEVNESMLTGESKPVKKKPGDVLMSGSFLVAGNGVGKVEHVGDDNYATQLAKKAKSKKRATSEMQRSIKRIIKVLGILIIPVGIMLFISQRSLNNISFSNALISTVAGIIGMIPEGLVLLTSVSFILGVGRLAKRRALVQEMEAIEALARVNVLCLDKTGTITTGELEVVEVVPVNDSETPWIEEVMNGVSFAFNDINATQNALMTRFKKSEGWVIAEKIPFSSDRKYRAVKFENQGIFVLGAPEYLNKEDEELTKRVDNYSREGYRVLLLGSCEGMSVEDGSVENVKPIGLIVISDCIRSTAKDTFAYFKAQQVDIKVISGDNPITVSNIAVKAGLEGGERYVDASTLPEDFEELRKVVGNYSVYGRVKPEQKQDIIKAYQANNKVVGMVGDGVNDVLALKDADCGIAMAAGSDAAKQVAHIVLLDSDFASMKNIVREGRMIITNIEKVSALYLTKTIYSLIMCVLFTIMHRAYPFIPIQLSWMSFTAIGIPSFILTLEQTEGVTTTGFLRQVLRVSLPAALTMVLTISVIQILNPFWNADATMTSTFNLLVGGMVSMLVVFRVCKPMNRLRRVLSIGVLVVFCAGILIAPGLLGIYNIFRWEIVFVIPMICMALSLEKGFAKFVNMCYKIKANIILKLKEKFGGQESINN